MFDFGVFDGPDGWERFNALKNAMHIKAVDEMFEDLIQNPKPKVEIFSKIKLGSELKDGTRLSREDVESWSKRSGIELPDRPSNTIDTHFEQMVGDCHK